jgi:hypothetical protein
MWNGKQMMVERGQFITGRTQLIEETGIPGTTIERILNYFENEQQIGQQKTTKFRLISILNWSQYQQMDNKMDNKRTTNGQQTDTNKNEKNEKNEKKKNVVKTLSDEEFFDQLSSNPAYSGIDIQLQYGKMKAWCEVNNKTPSRRRLVNWLNRAEKPFSAKGGYKY